MKNTRRLMMELGALRDRYGSGYVEASRNLTWIKLARFPLNKGQYNLPYCCVLILIPDHYDTARVKDCFVDADLRMRSKWGGFKELPHVHSSGEFNRDGYRWLCFHNPLGKNTGLLGFIETLRAYFTDPDSYVRANEG